jgi:dienelactone hydrolase
MGRPPARGAWVSGGIRREIVMHARIKGILSILVLVAVCPAVNADGQAPDRLAAAGRHDVRAIPKLVLHDAERGKDLELRITYPEDGGPYPLILFSAFAGGTKDHYQPLVAHWASHGYVVIQPNHSDSPQVGGKRGRQALADVHNRPRDLTFILDSLDEIERDAAPLAGKIDHATVGVGGHYIGAFSALWMAGMAVAREGGEALVLADPRPKAFLAMSPQGREAGTNDRSWAQIRRPVMTMTGPADVSTRTSNDPRWRTEPYRFMPPGDKYLAFLEGGGGSYGGLANVEAGPVEASAEVPHPEWTAHVVRGLTLAFWDAYLKGRAEAKERLSGTESDGRLEFERK